MSGKQLFPILFGCILLGACSGSNGPVLVTDRMNLNKAQCSKIEKDMVTAYTVVAAQEGVTRRIKKTAKYKMMLQNDKQELQRIMRARKAKKIDPYIEKFKKLEVQFTARCGRSSKEIANLRISHPSSYLR